MIKGNLKKMEKCLGGGKVLCHTFQRDTSVTADESQRPSLSLAVVLARELKRKHFVSGFFYGEQAFHDCHWTFFGVVGR